MLNGGSANSPKLENLSISNELPSHPLDRAARNQRKIRHNCMSDAIDLGWLSNWIFRKTGQSFQSAPSGNRLLCGTEQKNK